MAMCRCSARSGFTPPPVLSDYTLGLIEGIAKAVDAPVDDLVIRAVNEYVSLLRDIGPLNDPLLPDSMQGVTPPWWWVNNHDPFFDQFEIDDGVTVVGRPGCRSC